MAVGGVAEVGVQGDSEIEFYQKTGEGRKEEGKGEVRVREADETGSIRGGLFGESDRGGVLVDGDGGAQEREDVVVMEQGVGYAAEEVDADAEGVNVVHTEVIRNHVGENKATEDEREDGDADSCCSGEKPDEKNKGPDAEAEQRGNVDFREHIALLAMEALF